MIIPHTIAKPLEEQVQSCRSLVTHSETLRAIDSIGVIADVVLEKTLRTIVGEALRELNNGDQEC